MCKFRRIEPPLKQLYQTDPSLNVEECEALSLFILQDLYWTRLGLPGWPLQKFVFSFLKLHCERFKLLLSMIYPNLIVIPSH